MNGIAAISDLNHGFGAHPSGAYALGVVVGCLLLLFLLLAFSAFVLQAFARLLFGYWPSFKNALWTTFCNLVMALLIAVVARIFLGIHQTGITAIGIALLQLGLQMYIVGAVLEHPESENGKLGFPKAALLTFTQFVVGLCLGVAIFVFALSAGVKASLLHGYPKVSPPAITAPAAPLIGAPPVTKPATVEEAQREAVRRFPDLGVAGSPFNREFRSRYERYRKSDPKYFLETNWPISLAEETDAALNSR